MAENNTMDLQLSEYKSFEEKKKFYLCNEIIDNEADFDKKYADWIKKSEEKSEDYIFRGVNEAKFKMYTSAQRKWAEIKLRNYKYYYEYILHLIKIALNSDIILDYFLKNDLPINDFLILSLLQHYGAPSPFLDFSHSPKIALYFAFDGIKDNGLEEINKYVSFYRININKMQMEICNFIEVIKSDICRLDYLINNFYSVPNKNVKLHTSSLKKELQVLKYKDYKDAIPMFVVGGERGKNEILSSLLNFTCSINITNPRIKSQEGSFILNTSECKPLAEEIIFKYPLSRPILIECININKGLKEYIKNNYLININDNVIYPNDADSQCINYVKPILM